MRIAIVGGGIGGLAAAVALHRTGHEMQVLERTHPYTEVGSGLSLWPNAVRALSALGLGAEVHRVARAAVGPVIRTASGRELARTDIGALERDFGPLLMIHRADLLGVLRAALPDGLIRPAAQVEAVTPDGLLVHSGGGEKADLVVGADGIDSTVRRSVWPSAPAPRYAGYTAYRMITDPIGVDSEGESWGLGERVGHAPLADGRVYCFAVLGTPPGRPSESIDDLRRRFHAWHDPIPALLASTAPDAVLHHDIRDLPPLRSYVEGRVVLIGDAAHAMTPDLGQGACQALEDAVSLAAALPAARADRGLSEALARWEAGRRRRTQGIAARSRRVGAMAQWRSAPAVALRDGLVRLVPDSAVRRSLAAIVGWAPETDAPASV